jgi:hypothetical protein
MLSQRFVGVCVALVATSACASVVKPDETAMRAAPAPFPFAEWDALLHKYVDEIGRVSYSALQASHEDLQRFERVFAAVAASSPKSAPDKYPTPKAREAYYIDAYNVLVWKNVLNRLPKLKNVDSEKASFFFWTNFLVGGKKINLKDLEGDIIRPEFKDPRVHMALNCASAGCPRLPREAFLPEKLDQQLDREARTFVNERRNVDYNAVAKTVRLSRIFDWYKDDFGKEPGKVIQWINYYRDDKIPTETKIDYIEYDWTLNDQNLKR